MRESSNVVARKTALDHLLARHLRGASGTLRCEIADRSRQYHLAQGSLRLVGGNAIADRLTALPEPADDGATRSAWWPLLERLAASLDQGVVRTAEFAPGHGGIPERLTAPLPTASLLRIGFGLRARKGSESAIRWRAPEGRIGVRSGPGSLADALGWTPEELWVFERLREPMSRGELMSNCPFGAEALDAALAGLLAVGRLGAAGRSGAVAASAVAIDELATKLARRIGRSLESAPLKATPAAYRTRIAELLGSAGELRHEELLGVAPGASSEELQEAFEELARWLHPSNADRFGMAGRRDALAFLFERATEAYHTLADPLLRVAYFAARDVRPAAAKPEAAERKAEAAKVARELYQRAIYDESIDEIHSALSQMEQAAQTDPRAEYWSGVGRLQARNPAWAGRAIESYRHALELDPRSAAIRYELGVLYERAGDLDQARAQFQAAMNARPPHPEAKAAHERVTRALKGSTSGALGRLFGR